MGWSSRDDSPKGSENKYLESFKPLIQRKFLIKQRLGFNNKSDLTDITPWETPVNSSQKSINTKPILVNYQNDSPNHAKNEKGTYPSSMTILHT